MNVLLTSAGRRNSLLQTFAKAAAAYGGQVFAGDKDGLAPTLYLAHQALRLPDVTADSYVPCLLSIVEEHHIELIVPTIDPELAVLAEHRARLDEAGAVTLISQPKFVEISADKWLTHLVFEKRGIATPKSWLPETVQEAALPEELFVKPRRGSASRDAYKVTKAELKTVLDRVNNAVIQEALKGPEVTIDALLDLEGRPLHYVPRRRLKTFAGESIQGVTLADLEFRDWLIAVLELASALGARGPIILQAFLTEQGPVLTEVNPRFGGGFPLSYAAGGHYPEWILAMLRGERLQPCFGNYQIGLYMTRYYAEHFTIDPLW